MCLVRQNTRQVRPGVPWCQTAEIQGGARGMRCQGPWGLCQSRLDHVFDQTESLGRRDQNLTHSEMAENGALKQNIRHMGAGPLHRAGAGGDIGQAKIAVTQ
jgi:hypothetical protein